MDLKDIISISGKSGLFSVVGKSKNNVIVESVFSYFLVHSNQIMCFGGLTSPADILARGDGCDSTVQVETR